MNINDDQKKHLEFIQNIITRLNTNSFQIKSLCITILSAFTAIYVTKLKVIYLLISIFPVLMFWLLDSYYLQQERKFHGMYNDLIGLTENNKNIMFEISPDKYKGNGYSFIESFTSKTMLLLYLTLTILIIVLSFILIRFGTQIV